MLLLPGIVVATMAVVGLVAAQAQLSPFARQSADDLRVMAFNIRDSSIFPTAGLDTHPRIDRAAAGARMLRIIAPDVACLNEVEHPRNFGNAAALFDSLLPLEGEARWQAFGAGDTSIVSRYPLRLRRGVVADFGAGLRAHSMALADLPGGGADLYVICAHMQSRGGEENIAARERHADAITRVIRDAKTPGGEVDLPVGTAIVVLGDMNAYLDDARLHIQGLLEGRLLRDGATDTPRGPDWNAAALVDALPLHNGRGPESYTYRDANPQLVPGQLDRVLFTGSVLEARNKFVLNTKALSESELADTGLQRDDSVLDPEKGHYDHLPVVVDFHRKP